MTTEDLLGRLRMIADDAADRKIRNAVERLRADIASGGVAAGEGPDFFFPLLTAFIASGVEVVLPGPEGVRVRLAAVMEGLKLAAGSIAESAGAES